MTNGETGDSGVFAAEQSQSALLRSLESERWLYSHLPNDFPGESDIVEQGDEEGHPDEHISCALRVLHKWLPITESEDTLSLASDCSPSEKGECVGVNGAEEREDHHAVPVGEGALGDVSKDELRDLVREATQGTLASASLRGTLCTYAMPQYPMNGRSLAS